MKHTRIPYRFIALFIWICCTTLLIHAQASDPDLGNVFDVRWSPDGTQLAVFADNGLFIYDRDFYLLRYRLQDQLFTYGGWSSDGTKIFAGKLVINPDTLETLLEYDPPFHAWLNDGSQVITLENGGREIHILDTNNGNLVKTIESPVQIEYAVSSPDSSRILVIVANSIFIFDVNSGMLTGQYILPVRSISTYTWSPDGMEIAFTSTTLVPVGTPGGISSSDPKTAILYTLNVMDVNTGEILSKSSPLPEYVFVLRWSKDVPRLAGESRSGTLYVWDSNTLSMRTAFSVSGQVTGGLAYSPYGGVLAVGVRPGDTNASSLPSNQQSSFSPAENIFSLANDTIQLIVPEVSLENLATIQAYCTSNANIGFVVPRTEATLNSYISKVKTASNTQIPPGCAADLIAVANALITVQS